MAKVLFEVAKDEFSTGFPVLEWLQKQGFKTEINGSEKIKVVGMPLKYSFEKDHFGYKIVSKGENEMVADIEENELHVRPNYWLDEWKEKRRIE